MKILKFQHGQRTGFGVLHSHDEVRVLGESPFEAQPQPTGEKLALSDITLLPPTVQHPRIFGVGFNYKAHILETGRTLPRSRRCS